MATPALRPASFRGVSFFVDASTYTGGRRGTTHEFPGRDDPYREDLGRKARAYPVEAYLVGKDYASVRNRLITALEKPGPGVLIHPYYGTVTVSVDGDFSVMETVGAGGFAKLSLKFVESGAARFPKADADRGFLVGQAADALNAAAQGDFSSVFSAATQPQFVIDSATSKINGFADSLSSYTNTLSGTADSIANLAFGIRNFKSSIKTLMAQPSVLAAQMSSAIGFLIAAGNPSDLFAATKKLFGFGNSDAAITPSTSTRVQQAANQGALNGLIQILAVSAAAKAVTGAVFRSVSDAQAAQGSITDQLDLMMGKTKSDAVYSAMQELRAQVTQAIASTSQNLAQITHVTTVSTQPSLALVYDIYGALDSEDDVITRNNIRHPGFVPGGATLEVLDSG